MSWKLATALLVVATGLTGYFLFMVISSPLNESYGERIAYLIVLCFAGGVVILSVGWSKRATTENRHALGVATSTMGIAGVLVALAFSVFMDWAGIVSALALLGLIAVVSTAVSLGTWVVSTFRRETESPFPLSTRHVNISWLKDAPIEGKLFVSTFAWTIRLASLNGERSLDVDAIVDTGAFMTTLPESILRTVGVEPAGKRQFVIADGSRIERDWGYAVLTIGDQSQITYVAFGTDDGPSLLGALTLEEFALAVDPQEENLISRELIMY